MLKKNCPLCEKDEKTELIEILPDRRYKLKCTHCGASFVLAGSQDKEEIRKNTRYAVKEI
jgi:transposase-like protein